MKKLPIALALSALLLAGTGIASAADQPSRSYHDSIYRAEQQGTHNPRMERKAPPPEMRQGPQDGMKKPPQNKKPPQIKKQKKDDGHYRNDRRPEMRKAPPRDGKEMRKAPPPRDGREMRKAPPPRQNGQPPRPEERR